MANWARSDGSDSVGRRIRAFRRPHQQINMLVLIPKPMIKPIIK